MNYAAGRLQNRISGNFVRSGGRRSGQVVTIVDHETQDPATVYTTEDLDVVAATVLTGERGYYEAFVTAGIYDVTVNGQTETWDARNAPVSTTGEPSGAAALADLTGVDMTGAAEGDVLTVGADGTVVPSASGTSGTPLTYVDFNRRTAGDLTLNSTSWANVDTSLDCTVDAATGDIIEVGLSAYLGAAAVITFFNAYSLVDGSPVNGIGGSGASDYGVAAWAASSFSDEKALGGSILYAVQAGDISGGQVTMRLRYRTFSAANRTLQATGSRPVDFWVKNVAQAP